MPVMPCNVVQEYVVPSGVTAIRVEVESGGSTGHSSSAVTLQVRSGATVRLRIACISSQGSATSPGVGKPPG